MKFSHRVIRWFALVMPPAWAVVSGLTTYGAVQGLLYRTYSMYPHGDTQALHRPGYLVVMAMVICYTLFRGFAFHPAYREEYLKWLGLTPWRHPTPLPLGPVHAVWQDLIILVVFEMMVWGMSLGMKLAIPVAFLFGLAMCLALSLWITGYRAYCYQVAYALAATVWIASVSPLLAGICLLATYALAWRRLNQSFATFPWGESSASRARVMQSLATKSSKKASSRADWGWTYDVLSPQQVEQLPLVDRLLLSGLICFSLFALLAHAHFEMMVTFLIVGFVCQGFYCIKHVYSYVWSHSAPISLLGRFMTGRWVIPSYDVVLLPLVYYLGTVSLAFYLASPAVGWPIPYVGPAMMAVYLLLMNLGCADINRWRLTSKARLNPWVDAAVKNDFEQL